MKALTVRPPWSWAIADGHKTVENRPRPTSHRGPLAIHAAAAWDNPACRDPRILDAFRLWLDPGERRRGAMDPAYHAGRVRVVVAVVDVVDCHLSVGCCAPWGDWDINKPLYHWVLGNVRPLDEPVPAKGRLGLWDIDLPEQVAR